MNMWYPKPHNPNQIYFWGKLTMGKDAIWGTGYKWNLCEYCGIAISCLHHLSGVSIQGWKTGFPWSARCRRNSGDIWAFSNFKSSHNLSYQIVEGQLGVQQFKCDTKRILPRCSVWAWGCGQGGQAWSHKTNWWDQCSYGMLLYLIKHNNCDQYQFPVGTTKPHILW